LEFNYIIPQDTEVFQKIIGLGTHSMLEKLTDHYVIAAIKDDRYHQLCSVYDLLQDDIDKDELTKLFYGSIRESYQPETVKLFIHPDQLAIRTKIRDIVDFTLNKRMKVNELEVIFKVRNGSSLPVIIMEVLQEHFNVVDERYVDQTFSVTIQKR
jgi:hypothetical protein